MVSLIELNNGVKIPQFGLGTWNVSNSGKKWIHYFVHIYKDTYVQKSNPMISHSHSPPISIQCLLTG